MATIEELDLTDSGMGSSDIRSPEVKSILPDEEEEDDESLTERLIGLTEMFPEEIRNFGYNLGSCLTSRLKALYKFSCSATWIMFSTSAIIFAPIIIEIERAQMEEMQRSQQKQALLGPSAAMHMGPGMGMGPPVQR
ncbi:GSCOCG00000657001-RA-CDS [Cotesia congregata]|uniref:Mitochondrial import receptor subunit TOM22 homolog n=1 Tax=Cotesia congregata TaxID=51543 RepID=A0A8J2H8W4_COTCN|nr:GSCOCG00000657001-RA-CDS [Cotesia congregata]CAG5087261.1 Similar to tomm-22: Mitochondrial import receptor subunit TOM22 homolog (Caenorhabditis elegans) [Cotesia congregata]